jgi:hypothetical protein
MSTTRLHLATLFVLLAPALVRAADPAGTVAALQGRAEAQRGATAAWAALAVRQDVFVGDRLRTAEASRLKLLMRDDSVITLGAKSELVIDAQLVRTEGSTSTLGVAVGAVRAVVTDRYGTKGSRFEVKTPTAVAGVRGTGFLALVDEDAKRTRIVGLYDVTAVRSVTDPAGRREVRVGPGQITEVLAGALPTKPRDLAPGERAALEALATVGPPSGEIPGSEAPPAGAGEVPDEGSGDPGDPATPGPPGGGAIQRPDGAIDQPLDRLRGPRQPPPPPPSR